ncbi:AAA family ATPase [Spirillospora sp. CA-255316]
MGGDLSISGVGGGISGEILVGDGNVVNKVVVNAERTTVVCGGTAPAPRPRTGPSKRPLPRGARPVGRETELAAIEEALAACGRVQVHGEPGTGKSVLLRELAVRRAATGGDVVFLSAAGLDTDDLIQELFQACYDTSGYRPDHVTVTRLMGEIEALILLDDFSGTTADLRTLLAAMPTSDLVVASRERTLFGDGQDLELHGLDAGPARELLTRELGRELAGDESQAATELWRATGGRPAALVRAAAATRAAGTALNVDPSALTGALAAGLDAPARAVLSLLCALDGVAVPGPLVEPLAGPGTLAGLERLEDGRLAMEGPSGFAAAGEPARVVAAEAGLSPDATACAPALAAWVRTASVPEISAAAPVIVRVLLEVVEVGGHAAARDLARAAAPALALGLRWGAWSRVLAIGMRAARALGSREDQEYFEREDRTRLKALGKGAALGGAITAAYVAGQHAGAVAAPATAVPGAGGSGAGGLRHLLTSPSVLTATAAVGVIGGAAALGLVNAPQSASSPRADYPSTAEPVTSEPSREPRGFAGRPSTPDSPGSGRPSQQGQGHANEGNDGGTTGSGPGDKPRGPDCERHRGEYYEAAIVGAVNVYPVDGGYEGSREVVLTWPTTNEGGCFPAGDAGRLSWSNYSGVFQVQRIDGGCPQRLTPGRSCRLKLIARPKDVYYHPIDLRIPVENGDWGLTWRFATQGFVNPSSTPTTD